MQKCVIICNPNSGKGSKRDLISRFLPILHAANYEPIVRMTRYGGHAKKIVSELSNDIDLVISLGGDGTFNEVVTGNIKRKHRLLLSHIPLGTTNDIGSIFGMGRNPVTNLKLILAGEVKDMDICKINDEPFVYVAGLGKFTDIAYETPRNLKKNLGYLAYLINGIKSFNRKTHLFEMEYTANGETIKGLYSFVLICNASRMAGFDVFQDVKMDDGKFEVLMTNITKKKDIVKSLYMVKTNDITKVPGFYFFRTDNLKITLAEEPHKNWCIDGEKLRKRNTKFDISIVKGLKMLLPSKEIDKIFINEKDEANE